MRDLEPALEKAKRGVGNESEQSGGNGSGEDQAIIDGGDAAKDQFAQAAGADGGGDGRDADAGHGRGAQSREDERRGQGQLDLEQPLRIGEAEGARYFESLPDRCRGCPHRCCAGWAAAHKR